VIRPVRGLFLTVLLATSVGSTEATSFDAKPDTSGSPSGEGLQRFEVSLSRNHLDAAWPALLGSGPAPHLAPPTRFDSDRVIVHSVGRQPNECYAAEIHAVRAQGEAVLVEVIEKEPAPSCVCTFSLVEVFDVIRLDSQEGPATLCIRRPPLGC
jgi:hypothetical protein